MKTIPNKKIPEAMIRLWQRRGKMLCLKIDGHSMRPSFQRGDQVELVIAEIDIHHLKTGDIIAFLQDGMIIVHRYIKKKKVGKQWQICQRGDHLRGFRWINAQQIIGTATAIHRNGRRIDFGCWYHTIWNRFLGYLSWLWILGLETR
ncbi:MAG: hypothetical protein OMM_07234 [Candidatus Magnetoglobus multicellularis str. Araruama]|uniref:Peptidase S24/S26A/S26B/S26C domain-containing protein n=1 Tax=Candidatus Magnetoglobus multicellularis str. Araruama TaxID=890399 RepID=A0A1V1PDL4_9BACT|nr:MAG: hypothetical protein OMM_07234 [Candidatus Magnetoglobus multicellularis str. Araruama]